MLHCQNNWDNHHDLASPTPPNLSNTPNVFSQRSVTLDTTIVAPHLVSEYERQTYYQGISPDPPELLWRSDLLTNPFPVPKGRYTHLPTKIAHGVFNKALSLVWHTLVPKIIPLLKERGIQYSAIKPARFSTLGEDGKDTLGPIVLWIATRPTTTAENARDASPAILDILKAHGVNGVVVEWYVGTIEKLLAGPALLRIANETNPTHYVRRLFTALLGMPIATAEREIEDTQGSVAFFFHENKTSNGEPSPVVLGVSNSHVLRKDTTIDYEFRGAGAPCQYVRLAGSRRFQRGLDEIKCVIATNITEARRLAQDIVSLKEKPKSQDEEEEEDQQALETMREDLAKLEKNKVALEEFHTQVMSQWGNIKDREIGFVDWAPRISIDDVNGRRYTKDVATFKIDEAKFKAQFKGNVVDLGKKFTAHELNKMFYPKNNSKTVFKFPPRGLLRLRDYVPANLLASPDCYDSNDEPCLIVMKDGNTTDLTVGRFVGLEAYTCDEFGIETTELAIYNYNKQSGSFSAKGDSGSAIFTGDGRLVGILHSGMPKGASNHVTFAMPAWRVLEHIKARYPYADFWRTSF